jgi:hypothetical protein
MCIGLRAFIRCDEAFVKAFPFAVRLKALRLELTFFRHESVYRVSLNSFRLIRHLAEQDVPQNRCF